MNSDELRSPVQFLRPVLGGSQPPEWLREYETWWQSEGQAISDAVDPAGTPWLRMFDWAGARVQGRVSRRPKKPNVLHAVKGRRF